MAAKKPSNTGKTPSTSKKGAEKPKMTQEQRTALLKKANEEAKALEDSWTAAAKDGTMPKVITDQIAAMLDAVKKAVALADQMREPGAQIQGAADGKKGIIGRLLRRLRREGYSLRDDTSASTLEFERLSYLANQVSKGISMIMEAAREINTVSAVVTLQMNKAANDWMELLKVQAEAEAAAAKAQAEAEAAAAAAQPTSNAA